MTIRADSTRSPAPLALASATATPAAPAAALIAPNAPLRMRNETPTGLAPAQASTATPRPDTFPSRFAKRAFELIEKSYVDAIAPVQLTAAGLAGLRLAEPALATHVDGNAIVVTWAGEPIARDVPASDAMPDQLASAARLLDAITARSPRLAALSGSRLSEGFVAGMRSQLDQYSRALTPAELADLRRALTVHSIANAAPAARTAGASPSAATLPTGGAPVLKIPAFTASTADDIRAALEPLARAGAPGLILDLRGSVGGLTDVSAATADLFLKSGATFTAQARDPDYREKQPAHADGSPLESTRVAILVDGATSSAAESFAAALADVGRAVVIGHPTRGKGRSQAILEMPDGEGLVMSVTRFYGPTGAQIDGVGVIPAVCYNGQQLTQAIGDEVFEARRMPAKSGRAAIVAYCAALPSHDPGELVAAQNLLADSAAFTRALELQRRLAGRQSVLMNATTQPSIRY